MNLTNVTHQVALSYLEKRYWDITNIYRQDNVEIAVIHKDDSCLDPKEFFAIFCRDLNVIGNISIPESKYYLMHSFDIESKEWSITLESRLPLNINEHNWCEGVVLSTEALVKHPKDIQLLPSMEDFVDYVETCEGSKAYYNNKAIHYDLKHIYSGEVNIVFANPNKEDAFEIHEGLVYPFIIFEDENGKTGLERYKEYTNWYITRAYMHTFGNIASSASSCTYMVLDEISNVNILHAKFEDEIVNLEMHEINDSAFEIIDDEYEFVIASKEKLPKNVPIMAIYSKIGEPIDVDDSRE